MADYFDRLAARAKGDGVTARPPARTIVEPVPGQLSGSDDGAIDEILADTRIQARALRAARGLEGPAPSPAADGIPESRAREVRRLRPAPEARVDSLPQDRQGLIRQPDDQSPSTLRSGSGAPIPVEDRRARSAAVSTRSALVPEARVEAADVPYPARDAPVRPSVRGAVHDDAPRPRDNGPGIRPRGDVRSRVSPVGLPNVPPVASAEPSPHTVVRVSIGRVEVRATAPAPAPAAAARAVPAAPRLTLDAYLDRAGQRRRQ